MALFNLPKRVLDEKQVIKQAENKKKSQIKISGKGTLLDKIQNIKNVVEGVLGKEKDNFNLVNTYEGLIEYIDKCIENGICAFDTETTGLDCFTDTLVGFSLYTPNTKAIYVPVGHISYIDDAPISNQITYEQAKEQLSRLVNTKIIYHNAKFDYKMVLVQLKVDLPIYYDSFIVARLFDQKGSARLKDLYNKFITQEDEKNRFTDLFDDVPFQYIPINCAYIYAAGDAEKTFKLYEYQMNLLSKKESGRLSEVAFNIEFPIIRVVAEMELNGIELDTKYANELHNKYAQQLEEKEKECYELLNEYKQEIDSYRRIKVDNKLDDPINLSSPTQMAILLYDILKIGQIDKKSPRGTGEEVLQKINTPFTKAILEYRGLKKLLTTYIDKLPGCINPVTNRLHASFNQYGTDTGRFSSSDPNLQNIPSHNKDIRKMFKAREGYYLVGSDFSQQEPRLLSFLSNDENLKQAYLEGKDIYAWVASIAFHKKYEECLEFYPEGTKITKDGKEIICGYKNVTNPEGKKLRTRIKAIVLGVMYSKTAPSIAEDLKISKEEAQNIFDSFFKAFPKVETFIKDTQDYVRKHGYSETLFGRRRYIPEMTLKPYDITCSVARPKNFDPLFDFDEDEELNFELTKEEISSWENKMKKAFGFIKKQEVIEEAKREGIIIKDNTKLIEDGSRQCVNSVIQGSAADQTKISFLKLSQNKILKDLGFKLLLTVHDEIIGECPKENIKEVAEQLTYEMANSLQGIVDVPFKCDAEVTVNWYGESVEV